MMADFTHPASGAIQPGSIVGSPFSPVVEQLYMVSAKDIAAAARETLGAPVGAA